jgi:hypothetical protein
MFFKPILTSLLISCSAAALGQVPHLETKGTIDPIQKEIKEISGIIYINGKLYGIEDSGNEPAIFEIDSTNGAIIRKITLEGITNTDWEDLTQDENYIYIGDFGNNNGNRQDLKFYQIPKTYVTGGLETIPASVIKTINFSYINQEDFCPGGCTENTMFDCEAVFYDNGKLHLFTKNWVTNYTVHYTVPAIPSETKYTAEKLDSLNTEGFLTTSATMLNDKIIALIGYTNPRANLLNTECAVWLIKGFTDIETPFFSAAENQKISLGLFYDFSKGVASTGQIEGIAAVSQKRVLITSEDFQYSIAHAESHLYGLNLDAFIPSSLLPEGLTNFTSLLSDNTVNLTWEYDQPGASYFEVEASASGNNDDFKSIGKVSSSNDFTVTYRFKDDNIDFSGAKYYRIRIVTLDSQVYYSKILSVRKNDGNGFNLLAAPSPFSDKLEISFFSNTKQNVQLSVVDMYGRTLQTHQLQCLPGKYNYSMEGLSGLSSGVYFITGRTKDNLFIRKVLK